MRTGESCGFHRSGAMRITRNPDRMDEFRHVAGLSKFTGYELEVLSVDRIAELHPLAKLNGLIGGIYEPDDGHVDPSLATNAMAAQGVKNGGTIKRYDPVRAIKRENDHWLIESEKSTLRAKHVVNASGTWCWEVGQMMGLNLPVVPVLHQYLVTETVADITQRISTGANELPIIRDPEESWYVRQERDGLILGPYESDANVWSVDGVPYAFGAELLPPDLDRVEHIINAALERIPALGSAGIKTVVNGPITFTPDANPLIGPAHSPDHKIENAWLLTGSSMGVMEGGGAGWFLARWMTDGAPPMDASPIDPRRFGEWADRDYRVNKAIECFGLQFGVHYPYEERPAARNKRLSPLHDAFIKEGAVMGAVNGWERPNWFKPPNTDEPLDIDHLTFKKPVWFDAAAHEVKTIVQTAALADLSALSKFLITGSETQQYLNTLGANSSPGLGRTGLNHVLTPTGGVQNEFTVSNLTEATAYLTSPSASERIDHDSLLDHAQNYEVEVQNVSTEKTCIGLMGPLSRDILAELTQTDLHNDLPWLHVKSIEVAGVQVFALRISGVGYYGAYAANSMRLEKGYIAWSTELTSERTPEESGGARFVKTQNRKFIGREALIDRRSDSAWRTVLVEIEIDQTQLDGIQPFYAHAVFQDELIAGVITSAAYGYRCKKYVAFALLKDYKITDNGLIDNLSVEILGVQYKAQILESVPYDPKNKKLTV